MSRPILSRIRDLIRKSSFVRFLISGCLNTIATYAIYLLLLQVTNYTAAFTAAYVLGIAISFAVNRSFVFKTHRGWRSIAMFPLVYLAQYLINIAVLWLWIAKIHLPAKIAPLIAIVASTPVTFFLSRFVFEKNSQTEIASKNR